MQINKPITTFVSNTIDMQNPFEQTDAAATQPVKKEWLTPVFEVISKEIIKSGAVAGAEHTWSGGAGSPGYVS